MATIKVRGGNFLPGTGCEFRDEHFCFGGGPFSGPVESVYVGMLAGARVLETKQATASKPAGGSVLGGAGAGALAGIWFGPPGAIVGAVIGAAAVNSIGTTRTSGEITFEARFKDNRSLVGTVDASGWATILESWRISAHAAPREILAPDRPHDGAERAAPAPRLPAPAPESDQSAGITGWIKKLNPWDRE